MCSLRLRNSKECGWNRVRSEGRWSSGLPGLDHPGQGKDSGFSSLCDRKPVQGCKQAKDEIRFCFERITPLLMETS